MIKRRTVLKTFGVVGAGSLAGCSGDDNGDRGQENTDDEMALSDIVEIKNHEWLGPSI